MIKALRMLLFVVGVLLAGVASAEYGDVLLNHNSDKAGVRPVVFPHWFHRIRFRCKVCHSELGFQMRAGSNNIMSANEPTWMWSAVNSALTPKQSSTS